nr:MAG TPA: hypothetical protein [Crassvirales sp.]
MYLLNTYVLHNYFQIFLTILLFLCLLVFYLVVLYTMLLHVLHT